jgi:RNA polymerase sigma-70 factor (sigma-E family)
MTPDEEFTAFVASRWTALLRTGYLLTGSRAAAEDLVQTALTKTYVGWHRLRDVGAAEPYVKRTMVTTYTSWWRQHRGRESSVAALPERPGVRTIPTDELEAVVTRSVLWPHLAALPRGQRAAVVLRFYEDLSEAETAAALGCSVGTVKSQTHRALATLRAAMAEPVTAGPDRPAASPTEGADR